MDLSSIALSGLVQAQTRFERATVNLSNAAMGSADGVSADTVDLSTAAVSMLAARSDVDANIQMLKIANEAQRQILDLFA